MSATFAGEPASPDLGKSSVKAGARTSAKINESMPSSVQPVHVAQKPRTWADVRRTCASVMAKIGQASR